MCGQHIGTGAGIKCILRVDRRTCKGEGQICNEMHYVVQLDLKILSLIPVYTLVTITSNIESSNKSLSYF